MLSVVIPAFEEEECIYDFLDDVFHYLCNLMIEVIVVDDGSQDGTVKEVEKFVNNFGYDVRLIRLRRNFGQSAAMDAGIKAARGSLIVTLDADGQNDPRDIPMMIKKLRDEKVDCVCGWRKDRKDPFMKRFVSRGANVLRHLIAKDVVHDSGCTLKVFRAEVIKDVDLFGEMHRYIPLLLSMKGHKVTEVIVKHNPRAGGRTKYGPGRILRGFVDLLLVKFWMSYSRAPMHVFGGVGIVFGLVGFLFLVWLAFIKIFFDVSIGHRPLLLLGFLLLIVGIQFLVFGLLGDILIKIYYKDKRPYEVVE